MNCTEQTMLLYAVTDRAWTGRQTLPEQVESALRGGVTCVQLREKNLSEEHLFQQACAIRELCHRYNVPFLLNDNVDIALRCGADGVHVGQNDANPADVRKRAGKDFIIGVSAHSVQEALAAQAAGADYLGCGAMFSTATKTDTVVLERETLRDICKAVHIPVVAIGGIKKQNILQLSGCGANGVALVSAIFAADDIEAECRTLKQLAEKIAEKRT